jgi:hypothetical protein
MIICGCKEANVSKTQEWQDDKTTSAIETQQNPEQQYPPVSDDDELVKLVYSLRESRILTWATSDEMTEFRSAIKMIAIERNTDEAKILASALRQNPEMSDGLTTLFSILYLDRPDIVVRSLRLGAEGRSRSSALFGYASRLKQNDDLKGLESMYNLIPPSQDRVTIASDYVRETARIRGLSHALELVEALELKEEQTRSFRSLYPYIRDNRPQLSEADFVKFYALARLLDSEQAAKARTY